MIIKGDDVIFSTGKVKKANCGIIGIGRSHSITEGYDGGFFQQKEEWEEDEYYDGLTKDEQIEIADYMIARWAEFKANAS